MLGKSRWLDQSDSVFTDEQTGAVIRQLTDGDEIHHTFFFLTPSIRPAHPDQVGFVTHRSGGPQIGLYHLSASTTRVLTDEPDILPFSPTFTPDGAAICYTTRGGDARALDLQNLEHDTLASLPGAGLGECAVSHDGARLVTAFRQDGEYGLLLVDLQAGTSKVILRQALKIIHPQFFPRDPDRILYAGDPTPRLWTVRADGSDNQCLRDNPPNEFIVHESFLGASDELIFAVWPYRLVRMNIHDRTMHTIADLNAWHMSSSPDGEMIVTDTAHPDRGLLLVDPRTGAYETLCYPGASCRGTQWEKDFVAGPEVWQALRAKAGKDLSWMEAEADQVYGPQWTHPHPAFDAEGSRVTFTSDRTGTPQVYMVEAEPFVHRLRERSAAIAGDGGRT